MFVEGYIEKDLITLLQILEKIHRNDLVYRLRAYQALFSRMEDGEFEIKFKKEFVLQVEELRDWIATLKTFQKFQYIKIKQTVGRDKSVNLTDVYVNLTILREEPKAIDLEDEITYNSIAYLHKIANKESVVSPVDFTEELLSYDPTEAEIWWLIGQIGCGKTFLAKRTALRYGNSELVNIQFTICIPCRNTDWHTMESTRYEDDKKVDSQFIQKWLCLGLPIGTSWSIDLATHLIKSDGKGLLLIIDGLDEHTKNVPFKDTFLYLLLTRQSLSSATIILTSRPGVWIDISAHELKVDRYFQVLGFSPENRDLYFKKQIKDESKLGECFSLLERHEDIDELSLIPVNAFLFAALLKEDSTLINSLTELFCELTLYLIRRELTRMGLQEFSQVTQISYFHPGIQECLGKLGFIATLGVANRDLFSEENVSLIMGQEEYSNHSSLGLAHEHHRKESVGLIRKVWTFVNLAMQEFIAALWLSKTQWTDQCLSARYISHSNENFYLFKKVLRFLCGMLVDRSAAILTVLFHTFQRTQPIEMIDLPMTYQLKYEDLFSHTEAWYEISELYFSLTEILYETISPAIPFWFSHHRRYLPNPIYIYIIKSVSPNEWICFMQSLILTSTLQLIHIDTECITSTQFKSLLQQMPTCHVKYLSLEFNFKESTFLLAYSDLINECELLFDTEISIQLIGCNLMKLTDVSLFSPNKSQMLSSMRLLNNYYSTEFLLQFANRLSTLQYLNFNEFQKSYETLVPALCKATQLRGLHLYRIPQKYYRILLSVLPQFSQLQEVRFDNYSLLLPICQLSNLTLLQIEEKPQRRLPNLSGDLVALIDRNRYSLRVLGVYSLHRIGFNNWNFFLSKLEYCINLVQLKLFHTKLPIHDVDQWHQILNKLKSLVDLLFYQVTLYDTGFLSVCHGLVKHPTIRFFRVEYCYQTSLSCEYLINLIPTVARLETLVMTNLDEPDGEPIKLLRCTADEFSIEYRFN